MKNQFDGVTKNIKVSALESKTIKNGSVMTKVTDENGMKYSFFNLKKDGNPSQASETFKSVHVGDVVEIGYVEEEKSFVGDNGPVKYTQRTIRFAEKINPLNPNGTFAPGHGPIMEDSPF